MPGSNSISMAGSGGGLDRLGAGHAGLPQRIGAAPLESASSNGKLLTVDVFCKNCRKEANFMCSACKNVHYCSIDCQVRIISLIFNAKNST